MSKYSFCILSITLLGDAEPGADVPRRHPRARGGAPQEPGPAHVLHRTGGKTRAQPEGGGRGARHSVKVKENKHRLEETSFGLFHENVVQSVAPGGSSAKNTQEGM